MSKEYYVTMPFAGSVSMTIEAESEEEAINNFQAEFDKLDDGINDPNIEVELNFHEKMHEGNVAYYTTWKATAAEEE